MGEERTEKEREERGGERKGKEKGKKKKERGYYVESIFEVTLSPRERVTHQTT